MDETFVIGLMAASAGPAVVVVPLSRALNLARTYQALQESRTWGAFQRLAPPQFVKEAITMWQEENETSQDPDASAAFEAPAAYDDGDWPGWLQQDMLSLLPTELRGRFGQVMTSTINGDFLQIDPEHLDELGEALKAAGYACQRDDHLLVAASGLLSAEELSGVLRGSG